MKAIAAYLLNFETDRQLWEGRAVSSPSGQKGH
jgi:hypothetical protein